MLLPTLMPDDKRRHWRLWTEMLLARAARRVLRGEPPAKDIADDPYWLERARRRAEDKTEFKRKKRHSSRPVKQNIEAVPVLRSRI